ncbi:MAG: hypothetical protein AUG44_04375 [Actinobacteria bacterium 13_1_20CM_3_71_11]|nr:MAG: hypothetical protein AUG44_04375 [Actinobacteria bacterium 13_1_20CM_3_71_11]
MLAVLAASGTVLVGLATPSWAAAPVTLTLSATQGSTTGGGMITASTPAGTSPFFPGVDVEFQVVAGTATSCAANYLTPSAANGAVDAGFPMVIAANRIGINLPSFGTAAAGTKYNVCVYTTNNTSGGLVAQTASTGLFSIGLKTSLFNVWPPAGPAQGGTTITVSGANFPLPPATAPATPLLTATLGGLPLTVTLMTSGTFQAVTPPHAPSPTPVPLIVTTAGGTTILAKAFTYSNGITVSPNFASNSRFGGTAIDVQGVGFSAFTFQMGGTPDDKNAHVYLVSGQYDPAVDGGAKKNGELLECGSVMIVSDTELVCWMYLQASLAESGQSALPTRTFSADTHGDKSLTGITPALSPSDVGERISGTGIAPGTTIASVAANGQSAMLSTTQVGSATVTGIAVGIGTTSATIVAPTPPSPGAPPGPPPNALSGINPPLIAPSPNDQGRNDMGKVVTGPGIPPGAVITNISADGTTANLSTQVTTSSSPATTISLSDPVPVPIGTYTVTVVSNGTMNAFPTDASYTQSVVSSGSTFTVSDY